MKRRRGGRLWGSVAIALLIVVALALWQWETLARLAIIAGVEHFVDVRLSFGEMTLRTNRAVFEDVRVTSLQDEPIATIARLSLEYNLRDLFPGGERRFGLKAVEADTPHLTIIRRPNGTYNIPTPELAANEQKERRPLIVVAEARNGSAEVIDQSRDALPDQRHLYVAHLEAKADISTAARSRYSVNLQFGERADRLYPIRGRGDIDPQHGSISHRWTASLLPIAAAVNFFINSPALRLRAGFLRDLDARYFALAEVNEPLHPRLAASAFLDQGRIAIAGLAEPVDSVHGPVDVYDDGLLTPRLDASVAGVPAQVSGGLYDLHDPRLRIAVRGSGDLTQLRNAFAQAKHLPMRGPLAFGVLVEGTPTKPLVWVDLRSPGITYAGASVDRVNGLIAFNGREAGVINFAGSYHGVDLGARGRVALEKEPNAIDVLLGVHSPTAGLPYVSTLLPGMALSGTALATANDPKAIAVRGVLNGSSATQTLDAIFNVDSRGSGSIGPLQVSDPRGSLYARIALDRPRRSSFGLLQVSNFSLQPARATLSATLFGGEASPGLVVGGSATLAGGWGDAIAHGTIGLQSGKLSGGLSGSVSDGASFGATVAGAPQNPRIGGAVVVAGGRYQHFEINGNAGITLDDGKLRVHDTAVALGPLFLALAGTVDGLSPQGSFAPRYDLLAALHTSDLSSLLATVQPRASQLVQGSMDANLRVQGVGLKPSFAGTMSAPEASINGLAVRDLHGNVRGNMSSIALTRAHVIVGSSALALHGHASDGPLELGVALSAPQSDLADFNDFFDTGDTLAGTGYLALAAALNGTHLVATAGSASFSGARFRQLDLGNVTARWGMLDRSVVTEAWFGAPTGEARVAGRIMPQSMQVDLNGSARAMDLSTWLPMLGFHFPITGRLDAQANISGRYPDIGMRVHAGLAGGTAGPLSIERFEVTASASHGRGRIESATLAVPSLTTEASGTFGFRANDPLALVARSTSANIGDFIEHATGKNPNLTGSLDSTVHLDGTREQPKLRAEIVLQALQRDNFTIPRITGEIDADRHWVNVRNAAIDFEHGRALVAAEIPIRVAPSGVKPGSGPISGTLTAEGIDLSNFLALLPKGTQLKGQINGNVVASGTVVAPALNGSLELRDGAFGGPLLEKTPITGIGASLAFSGTQAKMESQASAGGGTLSMQGAASIAHLDRLANSMFNLHGESKNVRFDLPGLFLGNLNGEVSVARNYAEIPKASGNLAVSNARIPPNAFLTQSGNTKARPPLPGVAFRSVQIKAGDDVRLQSPNVDIGATGDVALGGTLDAPTLAGSFQSTGGTLSFYRTFTLESGAVNFQPSSGVIPDIQAVATTFVPVPATAVRLSVTGPATNMNLKMESNPPYSQEQILGLLLGAQNFGAVQGVASTGQGFNAGATAGNLALGQLNTLFTRSVLQPFSSSIAGALGFSEVALTTDIQSGFGVRASRAFGTVNAIFAQTFGTPRTTSFSLEANPGVCSGLRATLFTSQGPTILALQQPQPVAINVLNVNPLTSVQPTGGTNGVAFSYLRKLPCVRGVP
jgi:hypothetical protein